MEILAPAGSYNALIAAVQSGADAVYIGGSKFSARQSAKNFSSEEMKKWVDYCHIRGVAVHVAANILIKEKEREEFLAYVAELNEMGIDALIIQDIGMAKIIKDMFPDLPLHASTQMTAASLDAVKFLCEQGFSRVVLSRELSFEEIKEICKNSDVEIEVFVHGALCMCYSGQCLMSSIIGARSGNRGMCAQPCRLPYELIKKGKCVENGYLLSPKDLELVDELKLLKAAGVTSLKIEGRLKRPEYVAAVTGVYSKYKKILNTASEKDKKELENAFNRSGFTNSYFKNRPGREMMSVKNPGNVSENIFSDEVIKRCRPDANERKISTDIYLSCKIGEYPEITMTDSDYNIVTVKGEEKVQKAQNLPLSEERIKKQLSKLGNTPFKIGALQITMSENISLPISEINALRRGAVELLEKERAKVNLRRVVNIEKKKEKIVKSKKMFSAQVRNIKQAQAVMEFDVPIIYAPSELVESIKKMAPERKVVTLLPPIWRKKDKKEYNVKDGVLVSNIGQLKAFSDVDCYGGARLNIYNNASVEFYKNLKSLEVSCELNMGDVASFKEYTPLQITIYGKLPLMVMENCPVRAYSSCGEKHYLKDRYKEEFPLICAPGCYAELYNSKPVYMADKLWDIKKLPVSIYNFSFTDESFEECKKILSLYKKAFDGEKDGIKLPENTFTRGHYYRGAE